MEEISHSGFILLEQPTTKANLACAHCGELVHQYDPPDAREQHKKVCPWPKFAPKAARGAK